MILYFCPELNVFVIVIAWPHVGVTKKVNHSELTQKKKKIIGVDS